MIVDPRPGVNLDHLAATFRELLANLQNTQGTPGTSADRYNAYVRWANTGAQKLRRLMSANDCDRLILTRRFWLLQSLSGGAGTQPVTDLLDAELAERLWEIEETSKALDAQIRRWSRPGSLIVPDTSFYIRSPKKLEETDFSPFRGLAGGPLHVLIPILVVDELDGLKRAGDKHVRWRAGYTLAVFDRVLTSPTDIASLPVAVGAVTLEVLFDQPGHIRLPINDDEIISRANVAQVFAQRGLTVVTYDTSQAMRARASGLTATKLSDEADGQKS